MGISISICNQKGGVGKTTTAVNLAAFLAVLGKNTLLVDIDPQGNATSAVGAEKSTITTSVYDVLVDNAPLSSAIMETAMKNLFLLPANTALAGAEIELVGEMAREYRLRDALKKVKDNYDFILIDTPPSLSLLTLNSLVAADEVLIPIQCEYLALEGLSQLLKTIDLVRKNLHQELKIGGIVLTMYDQRLILNNEVVEEVREHFPNLVYKTLIPRSVRLGEAPSHGMPILYYDPTSTGSKGYEEMAKELLERSEVKICQHQNSEEGLRL